MVSGSPSRLPPLTTHWGFSDGFLVVLLRPLSEFFCSFPPVLPRHPGTSTRLPKHLSSALPADPLRNMRSCSLIHLQRYEKFLKVPNVFANIFEEKRYFFCSLLTCLRRKGRKAEKRNLMLLRQHEQEITTQFLI